VDGQLEELVCEVLQDEGTHVLLCVGRDLVLLIVEFLHRCVELPFFLPLCLLTLLVFLALPTH
jgi:hypothetical protein